MREKKEINIEIGERVKYARECSGLTQEQLAERIDVSTQYISDLERGVVGISISTLKKLCVSIGISSDQILFDPKADNSLNAVIDKCRGLSREQTMLLAEMIGNYVEAINIERLRAGGAQSEVNPYR